LTELRFRRSLYRAAAVDEAASTYGPYAAIERCDDSDYWGLRISARSPERERRIAGELANFALGRTVGARDGVRP
jgi:hypothetical protein